VYIVGFINDRGISAARSGLGIEGCHLGYICNPFNDMVCVVYDQCSDGCLPQTMNSHVFGMAM